MDNTEERYCDGCGAKLSSKNDNYDPDICGHFCNECFEFFKKLEFGLLEIFFHKSYLSYR